MKNESLESIIADYERALGQTIISLLEHEEGTIEYERIKQAKGCYIGIIMKLKSLQQKTEETDYWDRLC